MKITRGTPQFTPVVITLESQEEVDLMREIGEASLRIPAVLYESRAYDVAIDWGYELLKNNPRVKRVSAFLECLAEGLPDA